MPNLDEKDCIILNILQDNCRTSLTNIAKQIGLSVDSVKKRIKKMENIIFHPKVQIRPRSLGFANIVDVKIKLSDHSKDKIKNFIQYLQEDPRIAEIFSVSGEWDLSIVIVSKDADDLGNITSAIKNKFGKMIHSWIESTTLKAYKFEKYDMRKLLDF
jgi:Lrp/AsnC family leucine-responsive transcriptional regulator